MSLLSVVTHFCRRTNLPVPTTVYGSTDTQILQVMALLEEEGNDLAARGAWQSLTFEATHTTTAAEDQGPMTTIATAKFGYIKNDTIWDRTDTLPILGPLSSVDWQMRKGINVTGPRYQFRIRGGRLLVSPAVAASHTWAFEYVSKYWITDSGGSTYKEFFTADTDLMLLPEALLILGLRWRWKKEKGFDYSEDFNTYEMQVRDALGRDGGKQVLCMDGEARRGPRPGIFVPQYNAVP